ncbi:glycosyltransferase [Geobacter sp. AOG1]|uniref:glycosyltransferase n=1 Tax=Geobacter sp. AOG1 TaxID=1566346 RepID=UPI001CC367ED|nr:glycosyltransferase [Geobacter sp. AOG1]GFE58639.1 hypothetical protein AOG1_25190 [Geobacter sp. AOG1]
MSETDKPLVTFALFAYNQERFIREAVEGAFAQTYSPLQIILSDDCSSDRTFEIMQEMVKDYSGPHIILLNRNAQNLGLGGHVNRVMELAEGELIIASAGDDISLPHRARSLTNLFMNSYEKVYSVWSSAEYINSEGKALKQIFPGWPYGYTEKSMTKNENPVIGATHAWRRDVFDIFGPLNEDIMFEDNAISFRSYLLGAILYTNEILVKYRVHKDNITNFQQNIDYFKLYKNAERRESFAQAGFRQRLNDIEKIKAENLVCERNLQYIENEIKNEIINSKKRRESYSIYPKITYSQIVNSLKDNRIMKTTIRAMIQNIIRKYVA